MEDGTGEGVETGEEVEIGEVVETDDEEEIDEGDKNKLFKQVRPRISEKDDILLVLRQLQSREYSLPNFQHPVKLPEMSKVKREYLLNSPSCLQLTSLSVFFSDFRDPNRQSHLRRRSCPEPIRNPPSNNSTRRRTSQVVQQGGQAQES